MIDYIGWDAGVVDGHPQGPAIYRAAHARHVDPFPHGPIIGPHVRVTGRNLRISTFSGYDQLLTGRSGVGETTLASSFMRTN